MAGFTTVRDVGVYIAWTDKRLRDEIDAKMTPDLNESGWLFLTIPGGGGEVAVPGYEGEVPDHIRAGWQGRMHFEKGKEGNRRRR